MPKSCFAQRPATYPGRTPKIVHKLPTHLSAKSGQNWPLAWAGFEHVGTDRTKVGPKPAHVVTDVDRQVPKTRSKLQDKCLGNVNRIAEQLRGSPSGNVALASLPESAALGPQALQATMTDPNTNRRGITLESALRPFIRHPIDARCALTNHAPDKTWTCVRNAIRGRARRQFGRNRGQHWPRRNSPEFWRNRTLDTQAQRSG